MNEAVIKSGKDVPADAFPDNAMCHREWLENLLISMIFFPNEQMNNLKTEIRESHSVVFPICLGHPYSDVLREWVRGSSHPFGADGVHGLHTGAHADEYAAGRIVFFSEAIAKERAIRTL
ncbi:MAG: hypothetical protein LBH86_03885 [Oscillospiraceae bacterium]|jgi:hypothetical protein|nr:hypothetical protein [Oscillospiraceae bacterium]